jgi:hypothetical protein
MSFWMRSFVVLTTVVSSGLSVTPVDAGYWWDWGYPGYADYATSYYAPMSAWGGSSYAGYGPRYYGPSSGCCGSSCGGCQQNYAPACGGCQPCGCDPCGCGSGCSDCGNVCGGNCGTGCSGGNCIDGNCTLNSAPADGAPVPDNTIQQPIKPRGNSGYESNGTGGSRSNSGTGGSGAGSQWQKSDPMGDAPDYKAPARTNPGGSGGVNDLPMDDVFGDDPNAGDDPLEGPQNPAPARSPRTPNTETNPRPKPFGSNSSGSGSGTRPNRPAPGSDVVDPIDNNGAFKPIVPGNNEARKVPLPKEESAGSPGKVQGPPLDPADAEQSPAAGHEPEAEPMTRLHRDSLATTQPVVEKTRLTMRSLPSSPKMLAKRPAVKMKESSVSPSRQHLSRQ